MHGSRAEAPEEDEGEAVSAVLDEIAHIFKGGKGEGIRLTHRREKGVDIGREQTHPHSGNAEQE